MPGNSASSQLLNELGFLLGADTEVLLLAFTLIDQCICHVVARQLVANSRQCASQIPNTEALCGSVSTPAFNNDNTTVRA